MAGVVPHAGLSFDDPRDARERPEIGGESVGLGSLQEGFFHTRLLRGRPGLPVRRQARAPLCFQTWNHRLTLCRLTPNWRPTSAWLLPLRNSCVAVFLRFSNSSKSLRARVVLSMRTSYEIETQMSTYYAKYVSLYYTKFSRPSGIEGSRRRGQATASL